MTSRKQVKLNSIARYWERSNCGLCRTSLRSPDACILLVIIPIIIIIKMSSIILYKFYKREVKSCGASDFLDKINYALR